jgi:phosphoglycerate kinase
MTNLPDLDTIPADQTILVRLDLDLPLESGQILDNSRLQKSLPTLLVLLKKNSKLIVIGHLGRPGGQPNPALSLRSVYTELVSLLNSALQPNPPLSSIFISSLDSKDQITRALLSNDLVMLENLRFYPGEELNSPEFAANLAASASFFVNDAFAVSHRHHASISTLKDLLPTFYGFDFQKEYSFITNFLASPARPLTIILGGGKKSKLDYLPQLIPLADHILVAGLLPKYLPSPPDPKVLIAQLNPDDQDITPSSQDQFLSVLKDSATIIWIGPVGNYLSDTGHQANQALALALTSSSAYTLIGGGDTEALFSTLHLTDKINFVSFAGGAFLHLLSYGTLPAIKT